MAARGASRAADPHSLSAVIRDIELSRQGGPIRRGQRIERGLPPGAHNRLVSPLQHGFGERAPEAARSGGYEPDPMHP